eukprot:2440275-Karenia_brevis.AAC.1
MSKRPTLVLSCFNQDADVRDRSFTNYIRWMSEPGGTGCVLVHLDATYCKRWKLMEQKDETYIRKDFNQTCLQVTNDHDISSRWDQ